MRRPLRLARQRGVAVITALLLTTLTVTIVASLFWQQQVQVRSMENQRLHQQTKWILLGAIDLARFWLRQDNPSQTRLDGTWTTPVAETNLDQFVERERVEGESYAATLSGRATDAQARYNLANLAKNRVPDPVQVQVFGRLLANVQLDPALAQTAAAAVAATQKAAATADGDGGGKVAAGVPADGREPMDFLRVEDLLGVAGFTPAALERLRDFVIVLPKPSAINVNTAPAEVLAAAVVFSVSEAGALVSNRQRKPFNGMGDFMALIQGKTLLVPNEGVDIKSSYFLVDSQVRLDRAALDTQALIQRDSMTRTTTLVWVREN
ncbi:type II secretion system minor pseudopilin GspK [Janthinobacterium fluminis]|uniref:Type II secretion system protein K n=1 Tax=Janthinobacterium fluminis TaxID=2987524 RepID=A0ABT5K624_9BURK|nr:type II secretion system minor pseudopilin GspK [Janthinobacterium fluminis]MDC8760462.1 type II secretion system minor pseudopilin GspK [Janthinobacterium fluminis]